MWIKNNYRRNLLDMHIADWNEEFLSKANPVKYVDALETAGVQAAMVKAMPHTGLCNYPSKLSKMHAGLKGLDFFGEVSKECHKRGIAVIAYFSQVFDNEAYRLHPSWRCISADGKNSGEFRGQDCFRNGRYGIVCPNNKEYRAYVKAHIEELISMYDFEGMFLDMTFWPEVCYCPSCRERYLKETGNELPKIMDWQSADFRDWQERRERWMAEFAAFTTKCIKSLRPECTVEHQMSMVASCWIHACTEWIADEVDYTGGDYYGGYLQQSFINKYYRNISSNLPFVYHTSRCDPALEYHTTTKSRDELLLHVVTALFHNGAFLLVDAINPDGSIVPEVYTKLMKSIYDETRQLEPYVGGEPVSDVKIWFASHSKFDPEETKKPIMEKSFGPRYFMDAPVKLASILRQENIPYDVIGSKNIKELKEGVLAICHVTKISDDEMKDIENFVNNGGTLYVSGPIGHKRLAELMGVEAYDSACGLQTEESFTYMTPTKEGEKLFTGFDELTPLTVPLRQYLPVITDDRNMTVLAKLTLPYTVPGSEKFAAIHSNPPGPKTNQISTFIKKVGSGRIFYAAAPLEMSRPYMSRMVVANIIDSLVSERSYYSDAPKQVETFVWKKDNKIYVSFLNEQEEPPITPIYNISFIWPNELKTARNLTTGNELRITKTEQGSRIDIPVVGVYSLIELC